MTIFELQLFGITIAPTYYGLMYGLAFIAGYQYFLRKNIITKEQLEQFFFYVFVGVVVGGRLGYILFYDLGYYIDNPFQIFKVWEGGMSFHGGFLGVVFATLVFVKKYSLSFWKIIDELAVIVTVGLGAGRIGNYLNKELLGYANYTGAFAVEKNGVWYFPSPLLEAFLEGFVMLVALYFINKYKKFYGKTSAYFLILYGTFRSIVEIFFRTPDTQIGYIFGYLTMGTLLSIPMILFGVFLLVTLNKNETHH